MKRILVIVAALLLPPAAYAAGDMAAKGSPAYTALETLSAAGAVAFDGVKESVTRAEAAALASRAVDSVLSPDFTATGDVIDAAYLLLKEFQTDMMEKGARLSDLQQKMVDLMVMKERLGIKEIQAKQDMLFGMIGVKINGEAKAYMTDLVLYGDGAGGAKRYAPITQCLDLAFSASSGSKLKAEAIFRLENLFGSSWGSEDIYGIRKIAITGDFPVSFILGDYSAKLSPFTVWANDDARETEAKIFRDRRDMIRDELFLGENSWPVTGAKLNYKTDESFPAAIEAVFMAARLEEGSRGGYFVSAGYSQVTVSPVPHAYDQYMFAAGLHSDFTLKDVLKAGLNFADIRDIKGTGVDQNAAWLDNFVASADAEIKLSGLATAKAEFALSGYNVSNESSPLYWQNTYIYDTALMTRVEAEHFNTKAEAEFFVVGNSFTAYAAQSRVYDGFNNYPYVTQNNTWNTALTPQYYILASKIFPFTRYNNSVVAGCLPVGYNLMPYVLYENNAAPYGGATPNRQGVKAGLSGKYFDGMLMPFAKFMFSSEIVSYLPDNQISCPREFLVLEGGLKAKVFGVTMGGGYKYERTDNTYTLGGAHLDTHAVDAGLEYTLWGKLGLSAGFKLISFSGTEYPYTYGAGSWAYQGKTNYDTAITSYGAGMDYEITKQATASVSFTNTIINDNLNTTGNYGAQEFDARVSLKF